MVNGAGTAATSASAIGVREALASRADPEGKIIVEDLVEASVLMLFFIQKLGKASSSDLLERLANIGAILDKHFAEQVIEALRARGLISYATGRKKGGESAKMWKMKRVLWSAPPEIAQVDVLLEALVKTPEAEALVKELNASETVGDGESKARRELVITKYVDVRITLQTCDILLGSQPESPQLDMLVGDAQVEAQLRFWRWPDGALMLPSDMLRGWLRTGLRTIRPKAFSDSMARYIAVSAARIEPTQPLQQAAFPVIDPRDQTGKGLTTYEALQPGERFDVVFSIPTKGFLEPEDFVDWITAYAPMPIRGMSPARGGRFGKVEVIDYKILHTKEDTFASVKDKLSDVGRAFYQARLNRKT